MEEGERLQTVRFVVESKYEGWRLDRYLCAKIHQMTRARAQELIEKGIEVATESGPLPRRPKASTFLAEGMRLTFSRLRPEQPKTPTHLTVLYRDTDIFVVNKPAGMPMHPSGTYVKDTFVSLVREHGLPGEKLDPAHRLDRETSGIVICGNHPEATRALNLAFFEGRVKKRYLALVEGSPRDDLFVVDAPLYVGGDVVRVRAVIDRERGKESVTRFTVLRRFELTDGAPAALLECEPLTGRQHQIRAHLGHVGYPIIGDKLYRDEQVFLRFINGALTEADRVALRLERHALHASLLEVEHPADGRWMRFSAPLPPELIALSGPWQSGSSAEAEVARAVGT